MMRVISLEGDVISLPFCAYRLLISAYIRLYGKSAAALGKEMDEDGLRWTVRIIGKDHVLLCAEANPHKAMRLKHRREAVDTVLLDYKHRRKLLLPGLEKATEAKAKEAQASFQSQIDELDGRIKAAEVGLVNIDSTLADLEKGVVKQIRFPYAEDLFASMQAGLYAANEAPKNGGEKKAK